MFFSVESELQQLRETTRRFVETEMIPLEGSVVEGADIPDDLRSGIERKAKELGIWCIDVPERLGGAGLNYAAQSVVHEELGRTILIPFRADGPFGPSVGPILTDHLNDQQQERFLRPLVAGEVRTCFAITEPGAGSDAANIKTTARRNGRSWIVNGTKIFISAGQKADFVQVIALTDPDQKARGMSCFLVEKGTPGLRVGQTFPMMSPDCPAELIFEDCEIPAENIVGEPGQGFRLAQKFLNAGRFRHGPRAIGLADRALHIAAQYARDRKTFGKSLGEHEGIQWMLADSALEIYQARLMAMHVAWKLDCGEDVRAEVAMLKLHADEMGFRVVDRAIQTLGGLGLSRALPLERMFRDMRSRRITEGASEIQRIVIARHLLENA